MIANEELLSIKEASDWATEHLSKTVTTSNITPQLVFIITNQKTIIKQ